MLSTPNERKIVLVVIDGLGGLPHPETGKTELETAVTPNMDELARRSICGFSLPVDQGITPGSAPGHLGPFGYDPVNTYIGRGVLEAIGVDLDLKPGDIASRGNICTLDSAGIIKDRRAGRISTEKTAAICERFDGKTIEGVQVLVKPVKDHRIVVILRGSGLDENITDTDPQQAGVTPSVSNATRPEAEFTARIINLFGQQVRETLKQEAVANMVLLRGFSSLPQMVTMQKMFKLNPAAIASYPMYRGLAKLAGMHVLDTGLTLADEMETLKYNFAKHDFFFFHIKGADSAGEDGDFARKVSVLEEVDVLIPAICSLEPDVLVITGDHSTPAVLKGHSWHPVPLMLYSECCRPDLAIAFSESGCLAGALGTIHAKSVLPLAMANCFKLNKYGA